MYTSAQTNAVMRGLSTSVAFAHARVTAVIKPDEANEAMLDVFFLAQEDGYRDYQAGLFTVPTLFATEKHLVAGWESGQILASSAKELDEEFEAEKNCTECGEYFGQPCRMHA